MGNFVKNVLTMLAFIPLLKGSPLLPTNNSTICGSWIMYNNEKCMKVLDTKHPHTQEEGENACSSLSFAKLVTVKTSEKQDFLKQFFLESEISESVWLGLKENNRSKQFEWNDGSELKFNNLMKSNGSGHQKQCVEMNEAGLWILVGCHKKNIVVCEIDLPWQMMASQNEQRSANPIELERKVNQSENDCAEKILKSEKKTDLLKEATDKTIDLLKEAKERIIDIEQSEEPILTVTYERSKASEHGSSRKLPKKSKLCGEWISYNDEKCLKIADQVGTSQEDAEDVCRAFGRDSNGDSLPKLVTINSMEEQEFIQQFLFVQNKLVDNVWLGLAKDGRNGQFEWNDGSKLYFNNWVNQTISDDDRHRCVQMESGDGFFKAGIWTRASCERKNAALCERRPVWTLETLQTSFLSFKLDQQIKQSELQKQLLQSILEKEQLQKEWNEKFMKSETAMNISKANPVPVGFIYVQLAGQEPPTNFWPATKWTDISSNYEGLFFRVVGGKSAPFGQIQDESTKRLKEVKNIGVTYANISTVSILPDGSWSESVFTGPNTGSSFIRLQFRSSNEEIRPRNQAVKVWKRIQ